MNEILIAIALICQSGVNYNHRVKRQKKCVAEYLKCIDEKYPTKPNRYLYSDAARGCLMKGIK